MSRMAAFAPMRPEGDDLRDAVVTVLLGDVADDLVAAVVRDVEVDVGRLLAVDVEEALEDEAARRAGR